MSDTLKAALVLAVAIVIHGWFTGHRIAGDGTFKINPLGIVSFCNFKVCE